MKHLLGIIALGFLMSFAVFSAGTCAAQDEQIRIRDIFSVKLSPNNIDKQINFSTIEEFKKSSNSNFRAGDSIFIFVVFYPQKEKIVDFEFYHFGCFKPKLSTTHFLKAYREGDMYFVQARLTTDSSAGDRFIGSEFDGPWNVKIFFDSNNREAANIGFYIQ